MFSPGWLTQLNQLWGGKSVRCAATASTADFCCVMCASEAVVQREQCGSCPSFRHPDPRFALCSLSLPEYALPTHTRCRLCPPPAPQNVPVADAKPEDIQDLLGGALFKALFKWMTESGPIYLLPTGGWLEGSECCMFLHATSCLLLALLLHEQRAVVLWALWQHKALGWELTGSFVCVRLCVCLPFTARLARPSTPKQGLCRPSS